MAGVSRLQYSSELRMIRVMCSGRVDLEFIFKAFLNGQDGVFIGGCRLGECNYTTQGNYDALGNVLLCKRIMKQIGLDPDRLIIEFMSSADGILFAESISQFANDIIEKGPIGKSSDSAQDELKVKLQAVMKVLPYIRLVERERFRILHKSRDAYETFYSSDEFERLFNEMIVDNLAISQITGLLKDQPLSTGEIAEKLGLNPSEISKHISDSTRHGLIRYNESEKCFALA